VNVYESNKLLNEYLLFHYGSGDEILEWEFGPKPALNFAVRTVETTFDWDRVAGSARALDVGCAVGRSSFELSKRCSEVIGIDYSQAFVDAAEAIRSTGRLAYERLEEGNVWTHQTAERPDGAKVDAVSFEQGDAMNLRDDLGNFDLVHAANLLCRLTAPKKFLARLPELVNPGGQLVFTTPCTWMDEFTPRENWPEGSTLDFLKENLHEAFDFVSSKEMPFLIREHRRKFQWTVAQASIWNRKG
tara:strand:- start:3966 stop:4700 length:735 start_codon:yes stop_codon:yes gene_type:complete